MASWLLLVAESGPLIHIGTLDVVIIAIYFLVVLGIGVYLKRYVSTGEDFFMAGRKLTAWIAGLSFISANLSSLKTMGWSAMAYQYGMLGAHAYLIGAILFLTIVMMPFYVHLKHALGAGLLEYVTLGGLISAVFNEVLQYFLIWFGSLLIPILGLIDAGGWSGMMAKIQAHAPIIHPTVPNADFQHLWRNLASFDSNPMGIDWFGTVFGLGLAVSFGYWCTDFLQAQRVIVAKDLRATRNGTIIGAVLKMLVPWIVTIPGLLGLAVLRHHDGSRTGAQPLVHQPVPMGHHRRRRARGHQHHLLVRRTGQGPCRMNIRCRSGSPSAGCS